jgi:hypothetical protein
MWRDSKAISAQNRPFALIEDYIDVKFGRLVISTLKNFKHPLHRPSMGFEFGMRSRS